MAEIERWITVNGNHIPVYKGESKMKALSRFIKDKRTARKEKNKPKRDEFYQNRLNQIDNEIKKNQQEAAWWGFRKDISPELQKRGERAKKRIDELRADYDKVEKVADETAKIKGALIARDENPTVRGYKSNKDMNKNYKLKEDQKATNARALENMNEAQLRSNIADSQAKIKSLEKQLGKNTVKDEYQGYFPLGVGYRSDKKYTQNIERSVKQASENVNLRNQLESEKTKLANQQKVLNQIKNTGKTQSQIKKEKVDAVTKSSTINWARSKGQFGSKYSYNDYSIDVVDGTSFIYKGNTRIGMADSLKKAKAYVEILDKRDKNKK